MMEMGICLLDLLDMVGERKDDSVVDVGMGIMIMDLLMGEVVILEAVELEGYDCDLGIGVLGLKYGI
ncbi:hypothetical protein HYFRA_00007051 [Hymenoscyphus fraxineus]|uniref:Uncharacterized protein n=1 Tax=Hymenoscyphus fraxineus TaxID=746836 RepID=A0A9N9KZX3_9HELO|nr:hypothetical protein HYFRA_00007051 [Hymenoscyphus fraxineus]